MNLAMIPNLTNSELVNECENRAYEMKDPLFLELCRRANIAMKFGDSFNPDSVDPNKDRRADY